MKPQYVIKDKYLLRGGRRNWDPKYFGFWVLTEIELRWVNDYGLSLESDESYEAHYPCSKMIDGVRMFPAVYMRHKYKITNIY